MFAPEEALAYLTAKLDRNPDRLEQAAELAEDLGFLPLALGQAAAYISDLGLTCAEYRVHVRRPATHLRRVVPAQRAA